MYDREGNKVLMMPAPDTDRHDWLEGVTGKNISASASPNTSFAQLLDDSDGSVTSSQERHETIMNGASPDVMLAGLNSAPDNEADRGHTTGPAEAFYPPLGFQVAGDYIVGPEDGGNIFDDDDIDEGDLPGDIGNFIEFDGEDSSDGEIYMPADINEIGGARNVDEMFPHLNNRNVTAFRQSADPARAALNGRPALPNIDTTQPSSPGPSTPLHGRKRKAPSIPYKGEHYEGTTPVHRTIISTTKRRKVTT